MTTLARRRPAGAAAKEEAAPARSRGRRGSSSRAASTSKSGGWGSYDEKRRNVGTYSQKFDPTEGVEFLLKFVDDGPIAVFLQHWLDDMPKGVKRSYTCYLDGEGDASEDEDCPLDALGDKPSTQTLFNIINIGPAGKRTKPAVEVWHITSVNVADRIKRLGESRRSSPLNREDLYFAVTKTKAPGGRKMNWDIEPLKAEDLADAGWEDFEPFTAKELEAWAADGIEGKEGFVKVETRDDLLDLIEEYDL